MGNIDYGQVGAGMALDAAGSVVNNLNNELQMERKEGVIPAYDVRTDRFEIAVEAMGKVVKSNVAKREQAAAKKATEEAAAAKKTAAATGTAAGTTI